MVAVQDPTPDESTAERLPGDFDIWVFLFADLASFAFYFVVFMLYRVNNGALFLAQQHHLSVALATANTLVLLSSSWCVAKALHAARAGAHERAARLVSMAALLGVAFTLVKAFEWFHEIRHGFTLSSNEFSMFYFALTGVHLFHVIVGLVVLASVVRELREPALQRPAVFESGALYWHMVDLVWVVLFALMYLMR
jgi:nitric oxide reductase NorE protein